VTGPGRYEQSDGAFAVQRCTPNVLRAGRWIVLCALAALSGWTWAARAQSPEIVSTTAAGQQAPGTPPVNSNAPQGVPQADQTAQGGAAQANAPVVVSPLPALPVSVWTKHGETVTRVEFNGVFFGSKDAIHAKLQQKAGQPLDPQKIRADLQTLYDTGRYRDISVYGQPDGSGLKLVYAGAPRYYVGRVDIVGIRQDRLASLLQFATKMDPGTAFTDAQIPAAVDGLKDALARSGYYEPTMSVAVTEDDRYQQVNTVFTINAGPQARVGNVAVDGTDPGITVVEFRKRGDLNCSRLTTWFKHNCQSKVTRETTSNALSGVRSYYQKSDHLEGTISLQKETYAPPRKQLDYNFLANQGPIVKVEIEGAKISKSRKKLLVPVYEEGAVDNDLLNEGAFNIRDYMQQKGYFDVTDKVELLREGTGSATVKYTVRLGPRHKVKSVTVKGNKYFDNDTIEAILQTKKADAYLHSGRYSTQLVQSDASSIESLYKASGFKSVKVTPTAKDVDKDAHGEPLKLAQIDVTFTIDEGPQQKFGAVALNGVSPAREAVVKRLLSAETGQPYSLLTLANDRDSVLSFYVSHGFDHARIEIQQTTSAGDPTRTDVALNVSEGEQVFVDHVLVSGNAHTRQTVVDKQLLVHAGDPLDQAALLQTQRNLYNLALFSEVNAAVQNPTGNALSKNVLLQVTEAKRWDVTYGFGFEAQTGTPAVVPGETRGGTAAQNGKAGASPRVSLDVARINLRGTTQSLTLHATYGLLEQVASLTYSVPQFFSKPHLTASVSGGYSNVQNITTFSSSTLQGDFRVIQKVKLADTFIYDFQYRRVVVDPNSLEISPNLIPQLSEPVQVGGPAITYFHDTRDPTPLDAYRGQYFSIQEFVASSVFGSEADFNRVDISQSTYYTFGKRKYVFARNTRVGFESIFGSTASPASIPGVSNCQGTLVNTNPTCNPIPLPERLYAGGAMSHRGFGINDAGPRDLTTGYPVGGSAAVVNTFELRLPPPTLPYVGNSISFVVFHDMGNVFQHPGDMFTSIEHFHQPDKQTCGELPVPPGADPSTLTGTCNFNYYSHAAGLGARYKTPVGPIRFDFSYNLNPPVYPVYYDYTGAPPYEGKAGHFNFFFSIGQSF
jgi:outer membrane protein insertion porin family